MIDIVELSRFISAIALIGAAIPVAQLFFRFYIERDIPNSKARRVNSAMQGMLLAFASFITASLLINFLVLVQAPIRHTHISAIIAGQNILFLVAMERLYQAIRDAVEN